jgi:hypothetical protein
MVPDFSSAYSALDAMPNPLPTLGEMCCFMRDAGEDCDEYRVFAALQEYRAKGAVLAVVSQEGLVRYALRQRFLFRRKLTLLPDPWLPWGA